MEVARRGRWLACVLAISVMVVAACGRSSPQGAPSTSPSPSPTSEDLPAPVAQKRDAIVRAARADDDEALRGLLDEATFSYSFGDDGDPIGYWRDQEEDAHVPILGDIMPAVFSMPWAEDDGVYVWPRIHTQDPLEWSEEDLHALRTVHGDEDIERFRAFGGYAGWRAGIRADGTWIYFIAGD